MAPLALELAASTFELCKTAQHTLDLDRARDFVGAYIDAGGPVPPSDVSALIPLMRLLIRRDALLTLAHSDAPDQQAYAKRQIGAFQSLKQVRLSWI